MEQCFPSQNAPKWIVNVRMYSAHGNRPPLSWRLSFDQIRRLCTLTSYTPPTAHYKITGSIKRFNVDIQSASCDQGNNQICRADSRLLYSALRRSMLGQLPHIFLNASCDPWEIIGYLLCILYSQLCSAQAWLRYKTSSQAFWCGSLNWWITHNQFWESIIYMYCWCIYKV